MKTRSMAVLGATFVLMILAMFFSPGSSRVSAQGTPPPTLSWPGYQATLTVLDGQNQALAGDNSEAAIRAALAAVQAEKAATAQRIAQARDLANRQMYDAAQTQINDLEARYNTLTISSTLMLAELDQRVRKSEATMTDHAQQIVNLRSGIAAGLNAEQENKSQQDAQLAVDQERSSRERILYSGLGAALILSFVVVVLAALIALRRQSQSEKRLSKKIEQQAVVLETAPNRDSHADARPDEPIRFATAMTPFEGDVAEIVEEAQFSFQNRQPVAGGAT